MLSKLVGLFNQRDGAYGINVREGVVTVSDSKGREVDPIVAKWIAELISDQYDECYVYVGRRDQMLKVGMSSNLDRRE